MRGHPVRTLSSGDMSALKLLVVIHCKELHLALRGRPITVRYRVLGNDRAVTGKIFSTNFARAQETSDTVLRVEYSDDEHEWDIRAFSVKDIIKPGAVDVDLSDIPDTPTQVDPLILKLLRLMYGNQIQRDSLRQARVIFSGNPGFIKGARKTPRSDEMMLEIVYKDDHKDWHKPMTIADFLQPGVLVPIIDGLPDPTDSSPAPVET